MRIALLSYEYPRETGFGGIGTYTWTQARALARLGHEVHVLAGSREGPALRRTEEGEVTVWRRGVEGLAARAGRGLGHAGLHWSRNRLENAAAMRAGLAELARRVDFDVVEMPECGAEGLLLGGPERRRRIVRLHSPAALIQGFYDVPRLDRWLCARLERRAARRAGGYSSCSAFLAEQGARVLGIESPVPVWPNGIDLESADAVERFDLRRELGLRSTRRIVLFAGRLERRKGAHLLPAIARRVLARDDVALVLVGDDLFGALGRELLPRFEADGVAGAVHALGRQPVERVRGALHQADVALVPSLWESCPYAVLEAMAAAAPIVAAAAGGVPELIGDGREGLLAPVGDVEALSGAVLRLLEDRSLAERLAAAARARAETELDSTRVAERAARFYAGVAAGGSVGPE